MSRLSSSSYTFPLWTLILCSAFLITPVQVQKTMTITAQRLTGLLMIFESSVCESSQRLIFHLFPGEVLVIGSNLPIIAAPGDDVILPCHLAPTFDVQGLTVEWSKPDLKPDPSDRLSRVEYVHLYRDRQEVPDMKMASYFRRTELFMDDMKHGNISLKILNVSEEDNGRYRCFIPKLQSRVKAAVVELVVDPNVAKTSTMAPLHPRNFPTPDPQDTTPTNAARSRVPVVVAVVTLLSVLTLAGFAAYFSHRIFQKLKVRNKQTNTNILFLLVPSD
ncbi:butyrophilin subfamily 3 member A3-like isoform X4 [Simochromis diagramma]|uniref:butyrophilin subfamily 3 member A3-like isoform X4 n=1 Tax=Simochromis diagramma TaxID=43689 RepID=UPI001A7E62A8|nr:butyrophilin subfamily 3 member A3-like isoform X4 [Simochromis diagramma]